MTEDKLDPDANAAMALAQSIYPIFGGHNAAVVGAALCDLLSLMIAGHFVEGSPVETRRLRERILIEHVKAVRAMIPIQEAMLRERMAKGETARPN